MAPGQPRKGLRRATLYLRNPVGVSMGFSPFDPWVAAARQPRAIFPKPFGLLRKQRKVRNSPALRFAWNRRGLTPNPSVAHHWREGYNRQTPQEKCHGD